MDRRQALLLIGKGLCGVAAGGALTGCTPGEETPQATAVALDDVPDGGRLVVDHRGAPVELTRTGERVEARVLWCTHTGCRVRWSGESGEYLCACHGGRFDPRGRPVAGPPTEPLRSLPVSVADGTVTIRDA